MVLLHYLGCLWIFVGSEYFVDMEEGAVPWTLDGEDFEFMSKLQLIIYSTYWVCTVITTVGYGDYTGSTTLEYIFSFGIMFFGFVIFSIIEIAVLSVVEIEYSFLGYVSELDFEALVWFSVLEKSAGFGNNMPR